MLGLLHGPAELLPISSSGHVTVVPFLLGWPYGSLDAPVRKSFEVALHTGTAGGLVLAGASGFGVLRADLALVALVPPAVAGLGLEGPIEERLGTPRGVAFGLAAGGALLVAASRWRGSRSASTAGPADAVWLGLAQASALVPGLSRAGMATAAARARAFAPDDAVGLARAAGLPVLLGATALKGYRLARGGLPRPLRAPFAAGVLASFASTYAAARLLPGAGARVPLRASAAYRIGLAAVVARRSAPERLP